ncbi:hypothetical protein GQ54DRAFT_20 [Martensiomyces pterosporus]|nr:hypothetical protein GQ54DRAFT_20 [Martensiomyces pterosporus]
MVHVSDLGDANLQRIFDVLYGDFWHAQLELREYRHALPLAAVCSAWRPYVCRHIYRSAVLEIEHRYSSNGLPISSESVALGYSWCSNIDLVISLGHCHLVQDVRLLSLNAPCGYLSIVEGLESVGFSSGSWQNVESLLVDNDYFPEPMEDEEYSYPADVDGHLLRISKYLQCHLPNIAKLKCQPFYGEANASRLFNMLLNQYLRQLRSIWVHYSPIEFSHPSFSRSLTNLYIRMDSVAAARIPRIFASSLLSLSLYRVPHNTSIWNYFVGDNTGHTQFTNLEELSISFIPPESAGENAAVSSAKSQKCNSSPSFPRLETLSVRFDDASIHGNDFYSLFLDSPLRDIKILDSLDSLQQLDTRLLAKADKVEVSIVPEHSMCKSDLDGFTHRLFGSPLGASNIAFGHLDGKSCISLPLRISWSNLVWLGFHAATTPAAMVRLISQLPTLRHLHITYMSMGEPGGKLELWDWYKSRVGADSHLSTSLREVAIVHDVDTAPCILFFELVQYLTLRVPSLERLSIPYKHGMFATALYTEYSKTLAHLSVVE